MKALRFVRNVAALFLLATAMLVFWPGVKLLHADKYSYCEAKKGSDGCLFDPTTGACIGDIQCTSEPCLNMGCSNAHNKYPW